MYCTHYSPNIHAFIYGMNLTMSELNYDISAIAQSTAQYETYYEQYNFHNLKGT